MRTIRYWSVAGTIAVLAITVAVLGTMLLRQRARLIELDAQLHARAVDPATSAAAPPASTARHTAVTGSTHWTYEPGVVHLEGVVERPGMYEMPLGSGITAGRLIAAAGRGTGAVRVTVRPLRDSTARIDEWIARGHEATTWDGAECMVFVHDPATGLPPGGPVLRPDDTIWVAPH